MSKKILIYSIISIAIVFAYIGFKNSEFLGGVNYSEVKTLLNAVSATTTSNAIDIEGAKRVTLVFSVSGVTGTGLATSTFTFETSLDGTNFVTYNKMIDNVTNTNAQNVTRVANQVMDTNGNDFLSMDLQNDIFKFLRVKDTITGTTTSSVTVKALIDY